MQLRIKLIIAAVAVIVIGLVTVILINRFSPSLEVMPLTEYYNTADDEIVLIIQNEMSEDKGYYIDSIPYVRYSLVKQRFNSRFYLSPHEDVVIYTTPIENIKITADKQAISVNKKKTTLEYVPLKTIEGELYMAMPFVRDYSDIEYSMYENPNRMLITCEWGENELCSTVEKEASLRCEPDIKSPILEELAVGAAVVMVDSSEDIGGGFVKVLSEDGVIGYVKSNRLEESEYKTRESSYIPPEYTHITRDHDICMVWHQVTNETANNGLLDLLNSTKGVNTISPTWFSIKDNDGNISSLASERYVARAHEAGVEVWGLCNDFNEEVDLATVFSTTKSRERLENKLLSMAIEYGLDGINIDFEKIKTEFAEDYIQFLRELSVKCRTNGIVLSVDDYVPMEYRSYYDYSEQGNVADYVVIMAYDEHYSGGEAGSVSSLSYVNKAVTDIQNYVPADQVIIALPFYTRLWKIGTGDGGKEKTTSEAYGMKGAQNMLNEYGVSATWDDATSQFYAEFKDGPDTCKIWLENEKSIDEKLKAVTGGGVNNVAFWKLGFENTETWNVISNYINAAGSEN